MTKTRRQSVHICFFSSMHLPQRKSNKPSCLRSQHIFSTLVSKGKNNDFVSISKLSIEWICCATDQEIHNFLYKLKIRLLKFFVLKSKMFLANNVQLHLSFRFINIKDIQK